MFTEGFGLVNYSESDETDDEKDNPTSFVRQKTRNENIQVCLRCSTLNSCVKFF